MNKTPQIALLGNPNSGKTAVFNQLTGLSQKVSNYPGVTVEKHIGKIQISDNAYDLVDFPGIYGIIPNSLDEEIVCKEILSWCTDKESRPDLIICVLDSANISRNLYLATQIIDLEIPTIFALNMIDLLQESNKQINSEILKEKLSAYDVVTCCALNKKGLIDLTQSISAFFNNKQNKKDPLSILDTKISSCFSELKNFLKDQGLSESQSELYALNIVSNSASANLFEKKDIDKIKNLSAVSEKKLKDINITAKSLNSIIRYEWLDKLFKNNEILIDYNKTKTKSFTEKVDQYLTHPIIGTGFFLGLLFFIFWMIFSFASYPMDWVDSIMSAIKSFVGNILSDGLMKDLIVNGILEGIGAIVIFIPQILILMFSLKILEDSGYMARASFLMDRFMSKIGLHGGSILPLMSGYACAIPAIMATRTIDNWKERLITILILPLTSCSARLPVYVIMITAFIEDTTTQALLFMAMYLLGTVTAIIIAKILSIFLKEKTNPSFIMELPSYKIPIFKTLFIDAYSKTKSFVIDAGKIIFAISIVLWVLASFPDKENIEDSYVGYIGKTIEPVIEPMGFDWKIGIGLITSFAARETFVSTMSTIYGISDDDDESLKTNISKDYTPLIAISVMVFYVYAAQCMSTFAIVKRETNSWKWPAFMIIYMTMLAYVGSILVYQIGLASGYS